MRRAGIAVAAAAVVAALLSVVLAAHSGTSDTRAVSPCPVQALTCSPGQADPVDSASPVADATTTAPAAADGARAPGMGKAAPAPATTRPATGDSAGAGVKDSASSAASDRPTGTPTRSGSCATYSACGFPDADSTGPRLALTPHRTGALTIDKDGTVISRWDITGSLDVYANNVTIIDSRITSDNWWGINLRSGFSGLRILHTTITAVPGKGPDNGGVDYAVSNMGTSLIEVGWCDVSVFGDALSMGQGNLHDNYVHDVTPFKNLGGEWQHTNAVISDGGGNGGLVVRHNTLLNPTPVEKGASGSIGLFADTGAVLNVTVQDNWLAGGAYALYAGGKGATGIKVTGNVFSTQYHPGSGGYGPVTAWNSGGEGNVWSDNRMSDGRPVQPPKEAL
ncbi:hypothetical protein ITX44_03065 [Streptomyces sp. KK5PA1]|uniref:Lipoprotein n=1 Tax=Actinacidiphila acididurans TaxID=2784346 RepID=A0ABS2TJK5_9ACTN|nr:hypothetical protein [Actinacidiphila acididurans]